MQRKHVRVGSFLVLSALIMWSCQSTSPSQQPDSTEEQLVLSLTISDTAFLPDSAAWFRKGTEQARPSLETKESSVLLRLPVTSIESDTVQIDLCSEGIRTYRLAAWTADPPRMTARVTSDTVGKKILKSFQAWQKTSQSSTMADWLGMAIATGTLSRDDRTLVSTAWSARFLDSAAIVYAARKGFTLDSLADTWSGSLDSSELLDMVQSWKDGSVLTKEEKDALLKEPAASDTTGTVADSRDSTDPEIRLVGATGDTYLVDGDSATVQFTIVEAGKLREVKSDTTTLAEADGLYTVVVAGLRPDTSRKIELVAVDTAGNEGRKTVTIRRRASTSLAIVGLPAEVRMLEDSTARFDFASECPSGSTCTIAVRSSDTTLLVPTLDSSSVVVKPRPDRNGKTSIVVEIRTGTRSASAEMSTEVAPVNDAPSFSVTSSPIRVSPQSAARIADWLDSASAGPSDESQQKLRYTVVADSAASLVSGSPSFDKGALVFSPKGISGTVRFAITAFDDGDSVAPSVNKSSTRSLRVKFDVPPTLRVRDTLVGYEDQRTSLDTVRIDDQENPDDLNLDWTILDSAILPQANLRVKSVPGGYSYDALGASDSSGIAHIVWTLTDPAGNVAKDTTTVRILPVNDAPVIAKAPGLPDTILIPCLAQDTTLPKIFGDIQWEPGTSTQVGSFNIELVDTTQAKLFYRPFMRTGIQPQENGGVRLQIQVDTTLLVRLVVTAIDDGGTDNGGMNTARHTVLVKYTNTVQDRDGNKYTYRHMPDGKAWMTSNLYTRPSNGDTAYQCAGDSLWSPNRDDTRLKADCPVRGALYNWGTAMGQPMGCDTSLTCYQTIPRPAQGMCPNGWHVAEREEWSALMAATMERPTETNTTADSTYHLRSTTLEWGSTYAGWDTYPGSGRYGDFLVPTAHPFGCMDRDAGSTNGANFWLPHRPTTLISPYPVPGGVTLTQAYRRVSSDGICGKNVLGLASIRCVHD